MFTCSILSWQYQKKYFIFLTDRHVFKEKREKKLGEKAPKFLVKAEETQKDNLITAALSTIASAWVSDACCKCY